MKKNKTELQKQTVFEPLKDIVARSNDDVMDIDKLVEFLVSVKSQGATHVENLGRQITPLTRRLETDEEYFANKKKQLQNTIAYLTNMHNNRNDIVILDKKASEARIKQLEIELKELERESEHR